MGEATAGDTRGGACFCCGGCSLRGLRRSAVAAAVLALLLGGEEEEEEDAERRARRQGSKGVVMHFCGRNSLRPKICLRLQPKSSREICATSRVEKDAGEALWRRSAAPHCSKRRGLMAACRPARSAPIGMA